MLVRTATPLRMDVELAIQQLDPQRDPYLYVALDRAQGRLQLGGGEWSPKYSVKWRGNKVEYRGCGDRSRSYLRLNLTSGYIIYKVDFWSPNYSFKFEGECRMTSSY